MFYTEIAVVKILFTSDYEPLSLIDGRLPVLAGPGFGFEIHTDAVAKAAEEYQGSL